MRADHRPPQTFHSVVFVICVHCLFDAIGEKKINVILLKLMAEYLIRSLGKQPEGRVFLKALVDGLNSSRAPVSDQGTWMACGGALRGRFPRIKHHKTRGDEYQLIRPLHCVVKVRIEKGKKESRVLSGFRQTVEQSSENGT